MLPDEQPVEYILEGIDAEMAASTQPKVILFDIGGVVVSEHCSLQLNGTGVDRTSKPYLCANEFLYGHTTDLNRSYPLFNLFWTTS